MLKKTLFALAAGAALTLSAVQAYALALTPDTGLCTANPPACLERSGNETSNSDIDGIITGIYGVTELYKSDVVEGAGGAGSDSKAFAASYNTAFSNSTDDPANAVISYVGGPSISCPECYLLVKDGNQTPAWYLFDISNWDGTDAIELTGFWPAQGAISHVSIYGKSVPAPAAAALIGLGLLGFAGASRLKKKA